MDIKKLQELLIDTNENETLVMDEQLFRASEFEIEPKTSEPPPQEAQQATKENELTSVIIAQKRGYKIATSENMKNCKTEWLIDGFLRKKSLVMLYAKPGSKKSFFLLGLTNYLTLNNKIKHVVYVDGDNTDETLEERELSNMLENFEKENKNYRYIFADKDRETYFQEVNNAEKNFENQMYIIDSARNFIKGDMMKDKDVMPFLQTLQEMRDKGATIIFIHHQPKPQGEENDKRYKGSTAFLDSVDEAYFVKDIKDNKAIKDLKENDVALSLEPQKSRDKTELQTVILNTCSKTLKFLDIKIQALTNKQKVSLFKCLEIIRDARNEGISRGDLVKMLERISDGQELICNSGLKSTKSLWELLENFNGKYFTSKIKSYQEEPKTNKDGELIKGAPPHKRKYYYPLPNFDYDNLLSAENFENCL